MSLEEINLNDIKPDRDFYLSDDEIDDFIENTLEIMNNIIEDNPKIISDNLFFEIFDEEVRFQVFFPFKNDIFFNICDDNEEDIETLIDFCYSIFFSVFYPNRFSFCCNTKSLKKLYDDLLKKEAEQNEDDDDDDSDDDGIDDIDDNLNKTDDDCSYIEDAEETIEPLFDYYESDFLKNEIDIKEKNKNKNQIEYLKNIKQPKQRTTEWYEFRKNHITASNAYKVFENENIKNQIIYEKCVASINNDNKSTSDNGSCVNVNSPLHWGQKYEPISVLLYEKQFNTKITDFGCIEHPKYTFLAASPDGINTDENSPYYGYMLEIKNPVSRDIDGIPKKEYWIQCQLQMECCELDNCHFLETKFVEYENREAFNNDGNFLKTKENKEKGIIIYFSKNGTPCYFYKPLDIEEKDFDVWSEKLIDENNDKQFVKYIYWKLDFFNCLLIKRNKKWFLDNLDELKDIWNIILKERKNEDFLKSRLPNSKKNIIYNTITKIGDDFEKIDVELL